MPQRFRLVNGIKLDVRQSLFYLDRAVPDILMQLHVVKRTRRGDPDAERSHPLNNRLPPPFALEADAVRQRRAAPDDDGSALAPTRNRGEIKDMARRRERERAVREKREKRRALLVGLHIRYYAVPGYIAYSTVLCAPPSSDPFF